MTSRPTRLLACALVCASMSACLALGGAHAAPEVTPVRTGDGVPGRFNAITDVPGILVGQVQSTRPPYLTGSTVVRTPDEPVAGVDVRGGSPGTWLTDMLSPASANPGTDAIVLTGGSAWGMDVATGVMRWLEDREGVTIPIVPGAVIYDIGRGGDDKARPTASWGYRAMDAARRGPVRQGTVGAGTGALTGYGSLKGGVGTASVVLDDGTVVGALVVVNALGSTVNPRDCTLYGAAFGIGREFAGLRRPSRAECRPVTGKASQRNTTIAVVATSASMENAAVTRMAAAAQDGLARAMNPAHTLDDGDTVFSVATGNGRKLANNDADDAPALSRISAAAADTLSRAVAHAMLAATSVRQYRSYCDTYPSACSNLRRQQADRDGTGTTR
ncbi:P1 family peptidase [Streptomyces sp. NPDC006624]|uniref:P1 family peptidase n=1 Tax=Streptomyces sp. NPDC006624 TaxID=3154892 RepID=UPI0033BED224